MKVLLVHNYTKGFATGGEGHVFEDEARLLEDHGHRVHKLICSNSEATEASFLGKLKAFWNASWSRDGYKRMHNAIKVFQPDIVHVHNFFLIFSPSIFKAAHDLNIPVVVTLHNYRLVSPCSQLLRNNQICELCVGRNPWRIILYRCYKNSFFASLLRYRVYYLSKKIYGWDNYIDAYLSLTNFQKLKLQKSGFVSDKISVVPNFISDPISNFSSSSTGFGALFIGTVTHDKGIELLVEAWRNIDYPLTIVGDGLLRRKFDGSLPKNVKFVGLQSREKVLELLGGCAFLVMPSIWFEGLPLVILEAMAMGRPVVASGHGAMSEIVVDGYTGFHFTPGDADELRNKVHKLISNSDLRESFGINSRKLYEELYTSQVHYNNLVNVYSKFLCDIR
jgi:glycosyltransferase involved in cell wall biosynthesis